MTSTDIGATAAVVLLLVVAWQTISSRKAIQAQTMLQCLWQLQDDAGARGARTQLFKYTSGESKISLAELYVRRHEVDQTLPLMNSVALMIEKRMLPRRTMIEDWGGLYAKTWCAAKGLVMLRRVQEKRIDLWDPLWRLGEKAIDLEAAKYRDSDLPEWITDFRGTRFDDDVHEAQLELAHRKQSE